MPLKNARAEQGQLWGKSFVQIVVQISPGWPNNHEKLGWN
jgi:hypothetical protein